MGKDRARVTVWDKDAEAIACPDVQTASSERWSRIVTQEQDRRRPAAPGRSPGPTQAAHETGTSGRLRLAIAAVVLAGVTGCSTQPDDAVAPVIPPAQPAAPATGPGTYVGEAISRIGTPVPVRVVIGPDTSARPGPDAQAVSAFLRAASVELGATPPELSFISVEIDNTGEIDPVPLPEDVDVLDASGRGANFQPAYDLVRESQQLLPRDSDLFQAGAVLAQRLLVRDDSVRPGQVVSVSYVSTDPLADVAQVVVNGELARQDAA